MGLTDLRRQVRILKERAEKLQTTLPKKFAPSAYPTDPLGYIRDILKAEYIWPKMQEIADALLTSPGRCMVISAHRQGKDWLAGGLVNWAFDNFNPAQIICTAPTEKSIKDVLFKEVRVHRARAGLPGLLPSAPEMRDSPDHTAVGLTANKAGAFTGRHSAKNFFIFDEATDVDGIFWDAAQTMTRPGIDMWLVLLNPTDLTSRAYYESTIMEDDGKGGKRSKWKIVTLDARYHPNIIAALDGLPPPIPNAVNYEMFNSWVGSWCSKIPKESRKADSLEWPPGSDNWWKEGPIMKARGRGQWPTTSTDAIWTESLWNAVKDAVYPASLSDLPNIGVDVARFGCFDDKTEILTDSGWRFFGDLTGVEQVLTLRDDVSEWGPITQIHKYEFNGEMNMHNTRDLNFCVTDNHRMLIKTPTKNHWHFREFDDLPRNCILKRSATWGGKRLPETITFESYLGMPHGGFRCKKWNFNRFDWCRFLGWFVSEGNVYVEKNTKTPRKRIKISQTKCPVKIESIRLLLTRMGIKFRRTNAQFEFFNNPISNHLEEHCGIGSANKRIPTYIKEATPEEIDAFLETFCIGDGTWRKGRKLSYSTSSKNLRDDIHEVLAKIGRSGKCTKTQLAGSEFFIGDRRVVRLHDTYSIGDRSESRDFYLKKKNVSKIPYNGFVYCVSTPLETICTRRGGTVLWTGNSDYTSFHVRWGRNSEDHQSYNGWDGPQTVGHCKKLAEEWAREVDKRRPSGSAEVNPKHIPIKVDEDGLGGIGVVDPLRRDGYNVIGVSATMKAMSPRYPRMRDELWFQMADRAKEFCVGFGKLDSEVKDRLRQQLMGCGWDLSSSGQACVWSKDTMRELMGRSPDDADSAQLAFLEFPEARPGESIPSAPRTPIWHGPERRPAAPKRKLYGR